MKHYILREVSGLPHPSPLRINVLEGVGNSHLYGSRFIFSVYRRTSTCQERHGFGGEPPPNLEEAALPTCGQARMLESSCSKTDGSWLFQSAQVAIIKHHGLSGLNHRNLLLTVSEVRKSKTKARAASAPRDSLPDCGQRPGLPAVLPDMRERGRSSAALLRRPHPPYREGPTLVASSEPNYLPKALSPNTFMLGVNAST